MVPVVKIPNDVLRTTAKEILPKDITSNAVQKLIAEMRDTLKNTPDGVGLAAPQIGESLRLFIVSEEAREIDRAEEKGWERRNKSTPEIKNEKPYEARPWKYYIYINPQVLTSSRNILVAPEGCLSIPHKFGPVRRKEKIKVAAYDEHGKKFIRGSSRFFARVVQHELDHLDGILFVDKAEEILNTE